MLDRWVVSGKFFVFGEVVIFYSIWQTFLFVVLALVAGFCDEKISLKLGRWEYADTMPRVFGVGVTPFLEFAVTGLLTFAIVFVL